MDAVATATAIVPRFYALGEVPDKPKFPYGVYGVTQGRGDAYTLDSARGMRHGLATLQTFGVTADSALTLMDQVADLLLDRSLVADDVETTPLRGAFNNPVVVREGDPLNAGVIGVIFPMTFLATPKEAI